MAWFYLLFYFLSFLSHSQYRRFHLSSTYPSCLGIRHKIPIYFSRLDIASPIYYRRASNVHIWTLGQAWHSRTCSIRILQSTAIAPLTSYTVVISCLGSMDGSHWSLISFCLGALEDCSLCIFPSAFNSSARTARTDSLR